MSRMNKIDWIAYVLVVIGALNWGLVVLNFNLVQLLSFGSTLVEKSIYSIVGIAGLYAVYTGIKLIQKE